GDQGCLAACSHQRVFPVRRSRKTRHYADRQIGKRIAVVSVPLRLERYALCRSVGTRGPRGRSQRGIARRGRISSRELCPTRAPHAALGRVDRLAFQRVGRERSFGAHWTYVI